MLSSVFSVFGFLRVLCGERFFGFYKRRKTFNTEDAEKTENTEKGSHESPSQELGASESRTLMGRTVPTFRQLIDDAIARWSKFRRALRREDQEYFDRLFRRVRSYTQAATYQASDNPMEAILLSIALDQEKRLDALERAAQLPMKPLEQPDAPQIAPENKRTEANQRPEKNQRMDSRSLPQPARDEAVADRAEPSTPSID